MSEEGGTKIQRVQQVQQVQQPSVPQVQPQQFNQGNVPYQGGGGQQQQQQVYPPPPSHAGKGNEFGSQQSENYQNVKSSFKPPSTFKKESFKQGFNIKEDDKLKYSIYVCLIFIILNSKIVWKQIIKLPLMGSIEPSIIALILNSLLAGIFFYAILKLTKN